MTYSRHSNRHFVVGVVILVLGVILFLDQVGFIAAEKVFLFWPLILIYIGVNRFMRRRTTVGYFWGGFLILLGIAFQLQELGLSHIRVEVIWPVFLICAGILLILQRYGSRSGWEVPPMSEPPPNFPPEPPSGIPSEPPPGIPPGPSPGPPPAPRAGPDTTAAPSGAPAYGAPSATQSNFAQGYGPGPEWHRGRAWSDFHRRMDEVHDRIHDAWEDRSYSSDTSAPRLNEVNIFWGGKRRIVAKNFAGGEIVSIFGGFDIDLREADILGNVAVIEVVTIFGGGDIRIPPNWEVVLEAVGIFGGCGDRTNHPANSNAGTYATGGPALAQPKKLIIKGVAIFGGMNIKN